MTTNTPRPRFPDEPRSKNDRTDEILLGYFGLQPPPPPELCIMFQSMQHLADIGDKNAIGNNLRDELRMRMTPAMH
jgi:hypothetical protein